MKKYEGLVQGHMPGPGGEPSKDLGSERLSRAVGAAKRAVDILADNPKALVKMQEGLGTQLNRLGPEAQDKGLSALAILLVMFMMWSASKEGKEDFPG